MTIRELGDMLELGKTQATVVRTLQVPKKGMAHYLTEDVRGGNRELIREWSSTKAGERVIGISDSRFKAIFLHWLKAASVAMDTREKVGDGGFPDVAGCISRLTEDSSGNSLLMDMTMELYSEAWPNQAKRWVADRSLRIPFAVVLKVTEGTDSNRGSGRIAQFRLDLLAQDHAQTGGHTHLCPAQQFLCLNGKFRGQFETSREAADELLREERRGEQTGRDIRVSIENFLAKGSNVLFDPSDAEDLELLTVDAKNPISLNGDSAGAALAWGMYFLLRDQRPDPGVIALATTDNQGNLTRVKNIAAKTRAVAESGRFDTIIVADDTSRKKVLEALDELGISDEFLVTVPPPAEGGEEP